MSTSRLAPVQLVEDGLRYTLEPDGKKAVVKVSAVELPDSPPFTDSVNLTVASERCRLAKLLANRFERDARKAEGHLLLLLDQAERAAGATKKPEKIVLSEERTAAALALLGRADLLEAVTGAMSTLGHVGEDRAKQLAYLVATSRLLKHPLSAILLAPSGCGKSSLLEAVEALLPPEAVTFLSRITPHALYYAEEEAFKHKLVLVDEQAGTSEADYSIRTLQSKGFLTCQAPGRGAVRVEGPIALMSGTTRSDLNPENLSRCLEVPLDDSPEQTRRIQAAQRRSWTGQAPPVVQVETWQDAQRLLRPLSVAIPFAERLEFPAQTTHHRRGNQQLLGLIAAHALLYQHQRRHRGGKVVAEPADYAAVYALVQPLVAESLSELSPKAARIYRHLAEHGPAQRRELGTALGLSYNTAKRGLAELLQQELAVADESVRPFVYRVLDRSLLGAGCELLPPEALSA